MNRDQACWWVAATMAGGYDFSQPVALVATAARNPGVPVAFATATGGTNAVTYSAPLWYGTGYG